MNMKALPALLRRHWLVAALVMAVLAASGCRNGEEGFARRAADGAMDQLSGRKIEGRDGIPVTGTAEESLPLPEGFPADVALPETYAVRSVLDLGNVSSVTLAVPERMSTLFADTRAGMRKAGWEQTISLQQSANYAVLGWRKEARETSFTFVGDGEGTTVSVQMQNGQLQ